MPEKLRKLALQLDRLAEATGRLLSWLSLALVLVTFLVVFLRYGLNTGSIALQESITYLHALLFMLCAAYTLKHDAHVRVDIFYQRASPRVRAWIDLLGTLLLLLPVCGFILYDSLGYVAASWAIHEGSHEAGGLNGVYLLKTAIPLLAVLLLLQGISLALHNALLLAGHALPEEPDTGMDREI
jgi:TRAP-type mannitol/chloroaromatic compound transport system permease small subunit